MRAHESPVIITKHVTTSWNCLKAATAEIWPTGLSFPKVLQPGFLHFFSSVSIFFHPVTKSVSVDGLWALFFLKPVCYCKTGTLCELVCEQLFFLFQQNCCFSLSFIGIENFFALLLKTDASVSDIKSRNSIADTPWTFPNVFWHSFLPITEVKSAREAETFSFSWKKYSSRKRNCCKIFPRTCWMDDSE